MFVPVKIGSFVSNLKLDFKKSRKQKDQHCAAQLLFSLVVIVTSCLAALAMSYAHWMTCCVTSWMSVGRPESPGKVFLHSDWSR